MNEILFSCTNPPASVLADSNPLYVFYQNYF